jgi:gas vesicle protein
MSTIEKSNVTLSGFLVGAAVGAVVGAAAALLFAPKSGKETRAWLGAKTREATGRLGEAFEHTKTAVRPEGPILAAHVDSPRH